MIKVTLPPQDSNSDGDEVESKHQKVVQALQGLGPEYTPEYTEELWAEEDHSLPGQEIFIRCLDRAGYKPKAVGGVNGQEPPPQAEQSPPPEAKKPPQAEQSPPPKEKSPPPKAETSGAASGDADGPSSTSEAGSGNPKKEQAKKSKMPEPEVHESDEAKRTAAFSKCTSQGQELLDTKIPPRVVIIVDWFKEGDLGFVFAYRGAGKTWFILSLCIALTEGTPFGPWPVSGKWPILYIDGEMNHEDDKERIIGLNGTIPAKLYVLNHEVLFQQEGMVMNLASKTDQNVITALCAEKGIKGIVLDNLGCLFTGVGENEADEWGKVLPWLLELRRRRISAVVVHHSGHDTSRMRGTVKREDSAAWIIRLDSKKEDFSEAGANFISRFMKYRGKKIALDYEWDYKPQPDGSVMVAFKEASRAELILQWVSNGLHRCEDIAKELGVSKGTVSKAATKLIKEGRLKKGGSRGQDYQMP